MFTDDLIVFIDDKRNGERKKENLHVWKDLFKVHILSKFNIQQ